MNTTIPVSLTQRQRLGIGTAFGLTDVGLVRRSNEDNFLIDSTLDMAMVADGMGGHAAGELASSGALQAVRDFLLHARARHAQAATGHGAIDVDATNQIATPRDPDATCADAGLLAISLMFDAIEYANNTLYQHNVAQHRPEGGMGTTLTGICRPLADGELVYFHVGDSRLYCQRNANLQQLTHDQTLYQQAVDAGMRENLPARNMLLQAMGPGAHVQPEIRILPLQPNDVLLLCSDGLYGAVPHERIAEAMTHTHEATLEQACQYLIEQAKLGGGRDNITVLMVTCSQ